MCGNYLKTIGDGSFGFCLKHEDVQIASRSISFGDCTFAACDRMIELAAASGIPSNTFGTHVDTGNFGVGVVSYLIYRIESSERKQIIVLAHLRFKNAVHANDGTEDLW